MLTHPTLDQLALGLTAWPKRSPNSRPRRTPHLTHAEWLGLLVDREIVHRHDKRLAARLRHARLRHNAAPEDIDYRSPRGLDRRLFEMLLKANGSTRTTISRCAARPGSAKTGSPVRRPQGLPRQPFGPLPAGPAAVCRPGAVPRRWSHARKLRTLTGVELLILDDWGLQPLDAGPAMISTKSSRIAMAANPRS